MANTGFRFQILRIEITERADLGVGVGGERRTNSDSAEKTVTVRFTPCQSNRSIVLIIGIPLKSNQDLSIVGIL